MVKETVKKILLVAGNDNDRTRYLQPIVEDQYQLVIVRDTDTALHALEGHSEEFFAVILDHPSEVEGVEDVIRRVAEMNTYLLGTPVLILSDADCSAKDEKFLDDTAVGLIEQGQSARVVLQRISSVHRFINSTSFQEFSEMLKALPSLIYLKDEKGRYVFCSQYWHHLENYKDPYWTIRGKTDPEIRKDKGNAQKALESDLRIIDSGIGTNYVIEENDDGIQEFLQIIKEPLKDESGEVKGIIAIINNVTEQEQLRRELKQRSITDELTGLYNRAYFDDFISGIAADSYPLGIISADCDRLKAINDLYGHTVGDEYIRMAVTLFKAVLPENSILFRMGGDEFIAFLPNIEEWALEEYMRRLLDAEKMFSIRSHPLSVSFGAHLAMDDGGSIYDAVAVSDQEMYRNKRGKKARDHHKEK